MRVTMSLGYAALLMAISENGTTEPVERMKARLNLANYDVPAPFIDKENTAKSVKIPLSQHIGAPAVTNVKAGDAVEVGQKIAEAAEGLSVAIHASINGIVDKVTEKEIILRAR